MNEQVSDRSPPPELASAFEGWKTPEREKARRTPWIYLVLLVSFLVYAPSVQNDFTWDDRSAAMGRNGEVRNTMAAQHIESIPIYPEHRDANRPTTSKILNLFERVSSYAIIEHGRVVEEFKDELTDTQKEVLDCLAISEEGFWVAK